MNGPLKPRLRLRVQRPLRQTPSRQHLARSSRDASPPNHSVPLASSAGGQPHPPNRNATPIWLRVTLLIFFVAVFWGIVQTAADVIATVKTWFVIWGVVVAMLILALAPWRLVRWLTYSVMPREDKVVLRPERESVAIAFAKALQSGFQAYISSRQKAGGSSASGGADRSKQTPPP